MIVEQFDAFRTDFPDCLTVSLLDISSQTVLCVSSEHKLPQERLDALCATGAQLLDGDIAGLFSKALDKSDDRNVQESVFASESDVCLFMRSPQDPMEAVVFVCATSVAISDLMENAGKLLNKIAAVQ